jgi:hypothetical protein
MMSVAVTRPDIEIELTPEDVSTSHNHSPA